MKCQKCGAPVTANNKFCPSCGAMVVQQTAMHCPNCGSSVTGDVRFCPGCGAQLNRPVQQFQQPAFNNAAYAPPKKKHTGLIVFLVILIILIVGVAAILIFKPFGSMFGPKNLGVKYTEEDYQSAVEKTGVSVTFLGMSGETLENYKDDNKGPSLSIDDYNFEFSDYQERSFTLTPAEASAFLNEIAPDFFWFDDIQVSVLPDGTLAGSSTVDVDRLIADLLPDVADQIPESITNLLPSSVNIYSTGELSITNNEITAVPDEFKIGAVDLPEQYMTTESISVMEYYFSRMYTIIPGLQIYSLSADASGNIVFDGLIPQNVNVTQK
jgi:RNA polymerase subunit RPABC4/transcription elongation factor Spt4